MECDSNNMHEPNPYDIASHKISNRKTSPMKTKLINVWQW